MFDLDSSRAGPRRAIASLLALGIYLCALAAPALATAQTYEVDSTGDQGDAAIDGVCLTAESTCTLRAAVEESDATPEPDSIVFDGSVFTGEAASTIELGSALPLISQPLDIDGGTCATAGGDVPCVELKAPSGQAGIDVRADGTTIEHLAISGGSPGIRVLVTAGSSFGVKVLDNTISGSYDGIEVSSTIEPPGNLIEGNTVEAAGNMGIAILGGASQVFGNRIEESAFSAVYLNGAADGNRIGGDTAASENVFVRSIYSPIAFVLPETPRNEIARNHGAENGGPFILLSPEGGGSGPNGGIQPPVISGSRQSSATGTAAPGARVRLFRAAGSEPEGVEAFLGEAVADGGGGWEASFPTVQVGTLVTSTQTVEGGTSALSAVSTAAADPSPPGGGGGNSSPGGSSNSPSPASPTAPGTRITGKPKPKIHGTTAKFRFTATIPGSSFECKLDRIRFKKCKSPKTYRHLGPGKHLFRVRAVGPTGLTDGTAAMFRFKVIAKR